MTRRLFHQPRNQAVLFALVISISLTLLILFPNGIPKSYAHAFTIKSDPSPSQSLPRSPSKVDVYFSEPVDLRYSKLMVIDANGKQIDAKDAHYINGDQTALSVTLPTDLKDGVYTVSTKVLSATDGHVVDNAYVFGVGEAVVPSQPSSTSNFQSQLYIPNAIARFPALVGQVIVVGAAFATLWLWKPISKITWLKNTLAETRSKIDRNLIILMVIGSVILVVSDFGIIYVQANSINAGIGEAIGTKFGTVWIARTLESFILLAISLAMYRKVMKKRMPKNLEVPSPSKVEIIGILAVGLTILATTSLIGHGAAKGQVLPITIDFIHNLAASLWIGGIMYIGFIVVPKLRDAVGLEEYVKASTLSILIPRFSTVPVIILGVIVITGPFLLYMLESNLDLTLASLYGKWLIIKLSLAAVMIGLGGYNQMIIYRQALRASILSATGTGRGGGGGEVVETRTNNNNNVNSSSFNNNNNNKTKKSALSKFSRSTRAESIVGIALLAAVALLVNTGLPANEFQQQLQQQQNGPTLSTGNALATQQQDQGFIATRFVEDGNRVILSINPYAPGNNNFKISFLDSNRTPIDIKSVQLRYTQIEKGIGPINVDAQQISKGVFSANAAFGIPGKWNLEIEGVQAKANALNLIATYDLSVNPKLNQLVFNIQEFKIPQNNSQPLYPVYDKSRNSIWVGDTILDSGRILEYNLNTNKYIEHKVSGTSIVTIMALDPHNQLWYVDPLMKNLGQYNAAAGISKLYKIPTQGVVSGIALDSSNNIWLTSSSANEILKFNTQAKNFTVMTLPTTDAQPFGIMVDPSGQIWVAEGIGKLANIDPTKNYKVSEYAPTGQNSTLKSPTALLADPTTGNIYISEHDGHVVSVFNPLLKTFKKYSPLDPNGLPFGMALDSYGNLWVAEHTINKIAVINPTTGESKEVTIPTQAPFVQWLTSDSKGNIWLAEQRGNSLAVITSTAKLAQPNSSVSQTSNNNNNNNINNQPGIPKLGFSYADIVGPSLAGGIIVSALFYTKSIMDLKNSIKQVIRRQNKNYKR